GIRRDRGALETLAVLVGHVDGAVRRHLHVTVEAAALGDVVDRDGGAEGEAAVTTQRALGDDRVLRAVVDRVRIAEAAGRIAGRERPGAHRLVVDAGVDAA